jgi:hypothetical protein
MSRVAYIRAWPRNPATGATGLVAMAAGGSHLPYYLDGLHYRAGGIREPRFASALGFDENGWTGAALPTVSLIEFAPGDPALLRAYAALYWKGARIEVDAGEEYAGVGRTLTGTIADATVKDGRLQITVADFGVSLNKPAIQSWFAGTGGIEGDAVCEGRVKRRSYGYCANFEGRVLLAAHNIYEFGDPARPSQSIPVVRHMGRDGYQAVLGWQGSIAATLDALIASTPPQGGGMVAPSINCVKWWTQPQGGPLTADVQGENVGGYVETAAQIAARLLAAAGGPAIVNLADAIALRPAVAGLHIGDDTETTAAALDRVLLPLSLMWRFGTTGAIDIREWSWNGDAEVLQGRFLGRVKTLAPTKTRRLGYNRNHRQMNDGEIAADILAAGVSYADGTTLEQLKPAEGGANVTSSHTSAAFAGQGALATRNDILFGSHITSLPAAIDPSNLINGQYMSAGFGRYLDGTTIQALRPGEAGANITEGRVAAAFAGQGLLATMSGLAFGSPLLSGFGSLAGLGNLFFGSPYLLEGAGGAQATLSAFKTALGIASGFTGQGALASLSSLGLGSGFLTGFGGLAGRNNIRLGYEGGLVNEAQNQWLTDGGIITSLGIAGGFFGQGSLATLSSLGFGSNFLTGFGSLAGTDRVRLGISGGMVNEANNQWLTDGSVITGLGTAASIFGQGFGATAAQNLIDNRRVALGQNSAVNSRFTRGTYGWQSGTGTQNGQPFTVTSGVNLSSDFSGKRDVFWARVNTNGAPWNDVGNNYAEGLITRSPWGGASAADMKLFALPVKAGETIACAALVARHRCKAQVFVIILDEGGGLVNAPSWIGGRDGGAYNGGDPAEFDRVGGCTDITAPNARYAVFLVRMLPTGEADPYIFATEVMLAKVQPGQIELPAYNDGPADPVADQTSVNTASAITGQGALATLSSLANGSGFLTGFGGLSSLNSLFFGSGNLLESNGGPTATLSGFKTSLGQAASISGQGAFATISNLSLDSQLGGAIANRLAPYGGDANYLRASRLAWSEGSTVQDYKPQEPGANITESRTSSGIMGQTAWATFTGSTGRVSRIGEDGYMESGGIFKANVGFLNGWWPDEVNSNRTQNNTASAIAGQSAWATFTGSTGRVSTLNDLGQINGANVYKPNIGWLGDFWPQEGGANITEGRTASAIAGQGWGATASQARADNQQVRIGQNRAVNSRFALGTKAWASQAVQNNNGSAIGVESGVNMDASWSGARDVWYAKINCGGNAWTGGGSTYADILVQRGQWTQEAGLTTLYYLPVKNGDRLHASALLARHRCITSVFCLIFDRAQTLLVAPNVEGGRSGGGHAGAPANFDRVGFNYDVSHPDAAFACLMVRAQPDGTNTPGDAYVFATETMLAVIAPGQTSWPDYNDGPEDPRADQTSSNTAAAISGQTAWATFAASTSRVSRIDESGYIRSTGIYATEGSGGLLSERWPMEGGANVTEGRTAAAFSGQGGLATRNSVDLSNGTVTNLYAEYLTYYATSQTVASLRPAEAGSNVTEGRTAAGISGQGALATRSSLGWTDALFTGRPQYLTDTVDRPGFPGEQSLRSDYITQQGSGIALVNRWPQEGGANVTEGRTAAAFAGQSAWATYSGLSTVTVEQRTQRLQTDGYIESSTIYKSGSGYLSSFWAQEGGANVTEGRTAAAINGQGAFATKSQISMWETNSFLQYGAIRMDYSITRSDGTTTVTETMAITQLGISAGFSGQGIGATSNSLADLDPAQNSKLNGLVTGGRRAYGYGSAARIVLQPGATAFFEAAARVNAGGNNGTMAARIDVSLAGQNSYAAIGTGDTDTVGPSEAGFGAVQASFTNNHGTTKAFDVRVEVTRMGSGAGGAIDVTETYLLA